MSFWTVHLNPAPSTFDAFDHPVEPSTYTSTRANNEQCEQFTLCEQSEQRTVRTVHIVRTVRTTNSANSSHCPNSPNSEQCEQFTLYEQCEQRTVRTVHFLKIVEQGEQCEQVRTLFGGACPNPDILVQIQTNA